MANDLTPFQHLRALLYNQSQTAGGDTKPHEEFERYVNTSEDDEARFKTHIREVAEQHGFTRADQIDQIQEAAYREHMTRGGEVFQPQHSSQQAPGVSLFGSKKRNGNEGGEYPPDEINPAVKKIQSIQEKKLLDQFDAIINDSSLTEGARSEALEKLFSNIDAEALLKDQYDIVHKHLLESKAVGDSLNSKTEDEKRKYLEDLENKKKARFAKHLEELKEETGEKSEDEKKRDKDLFSIPEGESVEQKKQREEALRKAFKDRLAQNHGRLGNAALRAVEVFEIDEEYPNIANIDRAVLMAQLYAALEANQESKLQNAALGAQMEAAQMEQLAALQASQEQDDESYSQQSSNQQPNNGRGTSHPRKRLNNARNDINNAKTALKVGRTLAGAGEAAEGAEAATFLGLTWEFWGPILIAVIAFLAALVVVVFLVFFILSFLQNQSAQSAPPSTMPTATSCSPSSTCEGLLNQMGINLSGNLSLNGDPYGKAKLAYDTLASITQSPSKFGTLLGLPKKTILLDFWNGGCVGHADTNGIVDLYGFGSCGTGVARFMLIHELSHVIAFRNPGLYTRFINQFSVLGSARLYWATHFFPTYNCNFDYGIGPYPAECFADASAEYVVYKTYRNTVGNRPIYFEYTFSSYPSRFSNVYTFMGTNIYGGAQF